jgi:hypothetical protein
MNCVFFKCLGTGDYHVHVFVTPEEACSFFGISRNRCKEWREYMDMHGPSVYRDIIKGYSLVFLDAGTEESFFDQFSESSEKIVLKLVHILRPLICAEHGDSYYSSLILNQEHKEKAINLVEWLSTNVLAPRTLLLSRGFSEDELCWLQAYVGLKVHYSMRGLSRLKN